MRRVVIALFLIFLVGLNSITSFAEGLGICTHVDQGYNPYDNLDVIENAGIKWLRDECRWDSVETTKGSFAVPKRMVNYYKTAKENGVNTLLVLAFGNDAYILSDGARAELTELPTLAESEYMEGWRQYVRTIVAELGDYIDVYEVWNEPNLSGFNTMITNNTVSTYNKAARAYAELYIETKAILNELQPGKPVLFGALSGYAGQVAQIFVNSMKTVAEERGMTLDEVLDDISYHYYIDARWHMYDGTASWKREILDKYGIDARLWYTETGLSEAVDSTAEGSDAPYTQAEYLPIAALEWDRFLFQEGIEGVAFWYDLRNDPGHGAYESSFGIVDKDYHPKDSFYAMQVRNKAVNYMPLVHYETPLIYSGLLGTQKVYGILGTYSDGVDTTYVGYHEDKRDGEVSVSLSGTKAYVYDYLGNVIDEIAVNADNDTYDMPIEDTIVYVACVNPRTYINYINYDKLHNVIAMNGEVSELDVTEIEVTMKDSNANVVYSEILPVKDGIFETEFTFSQNGTYTLIAGADATEYYASENVIIDSSDTSITLGDSAVFISNNKITVTGIVDGAKDGESVSVLVVPAAIDLKNLKAENIAYIDDVEIENGLYSLTFTMPKASEGIYQILLSGANLSNSNIKESVVYGMASEYVNVCEFNYTFGNNTILVTSKVNNPLPIAKTCDIIVVQYDNRGALAEVSVTPVSVDANVVQAIEKTATATKASDAVTLKAFIWDSLGNIYPLVEGLPIPFN